MATFLTNSKMNPRLAGRVHASTRGRTSGGAAGISSATRTALLRLSILAALSLALFFVIKEQRDRAAELADAKQKLKAEMSDARTAFPASAMGRSDEALTWLKKECQTYPGDVAAAAGAQRWLEWLKRKIVYARVEVSGLTASNQTEQVVSESRKDAFVLCLYDPPPDVSEPALMKQVSLAYRGGPNTQQRTENVYRLADAIVVRQLLDQKVDDQIERADELPNVLALQRVWDQARVTDRVGAMTAELLLAVLDEPKTPGTVVELDGASDHWARVLLIDLTSSTVLYRARKHLKTDWVSERRRSQYASGLNACRLATELRQPGLIAE